MSPGLTTTSNSESDLAEQLSASDNVLKVCKACLFQGSKKLCQSHHLIGGPEVLFYFIDQKSGDQAQLFHCVKDLLCEPSKVSFPVDICLKTLANEFGKLFEQKVDKIYQSLEAIAIVLSFSQPAVQHQLTSFKPLSPEQVQELIVKAPIKSCPLDPIPSSILVQLMDVLLPALTTMTNLSFVEGHFANVWKDLCSKSQAWLWLTRTFAL